MRLALVLEARSLVPPLISQGRLRCSSFSLCDKRISKAALGLPHCQHVWQSRAKRCGVHLTEDRGPNLGPSRRKVRPLAGLQGNRNNQGAKQFGSSRGEQTCLWCGAPNLLPFDGG